MVLEISKSSLTHCRAITYNITKKCDITNITKHLSRIFRLSNFVNGTMCMIKKSYIKFHIRNCKQITSLLTKANVVMRGSATK